MNIKTHTLGTASLTGVKAILVLLLLTGPYTGWSAIESGLSTFRAEYTVENDYITGGVATLSLTPADGGGFDFVLQTKPTGIFKLTGNGNIREHAILPSLNPPFESVQYLYKDKGKPERDYQVNFDRDEGSIDIKKGSKISTHSLPDGVVDRLSVTLALIHQHKTDRNFETLQVQVLDDSDAETVTYSNHGEESLKTRIGDFQANRILIDRVNSNRETIIWLAEVGPANTVLPLKIEQYKRGKLSLRLIISKFALVD